MRILQVVEPGKDGVFRHVEGLVDYLLRQGHVVNFAYSDVRGSDRLYKLVDQVKESGGGVLNLKISNAPHPADVPAYLRFRHFIKKTRSQVGHAHSSKAGMLLRASFFQGSLPMFYTPNAYYGMAGRGGVSEKVFNLAETVLGKVGTTINVSTDEAEFARKVLGLDSRKQVVINNAVDTDLFRPGLETERIAWRKEHNLPEDAIILGTLGRTSYQKDPITLYRAFNKVAQDNPKLYLAHVGVGELYGECTQLIKEMGLADRIIRINYIAAPAAFYSILDAFILSSRYEGLSFAVLEALASGLPLILTDVPGNRDFLNLGLSHTWSSAPGDHGALASAMSQWLKDISGKRPCNHREVAEMRFSFDFCYGKIVELFEKSLAKN